MASNTIGATSEEVAATSPPGFERLEDAVEEIGDLKTSKPEQHACCAGVHPFIAYNVEIRRVLFSTNAPADRTPWSDGV